MPEMPRSTHSNLLADKSCYAYGTDEIYEVPSMWKVELAEESSDKRRISFPQKMTPKGEKGWVFPSRKSNLII